MEGRAIGEGKFNIVSADVHPWTHQEEWRKTCWTLVRVLVGSYMFHYDFIRCSCRNIRALFWMNGSTHTLTQHVWFKDAQLTINSRALELSLVVQYQHLFNKNRNYNGNKVFLYYIKYATVTALKNNLSYWVLKALSGCGLIRFNWQCWQHKLSICHCILIQIKRRSDWRTEPHPNQWETHRHKQISCEINGKKTHNKTKRFLYWQTHVCFM